MRTQQEVSSVQPGRGPSPETAPADTLIPDFIVQNCANKLLIINHPVWDTLLQQPGRTKTQVELHLIHYIRTHV